MGEYKNKAFTLRAEEETMDKIKAIADKEGRTANKQIEYILKLYVDNYETTNGTINTNKTINMKDNNGTINM